MRTISNLLGFLAASGNGNSTPEDGDTVLKVPGMFLPAGHLVFPVLNVFTSNVLPGTTSVMGSFFWDYSQPMNANSGTDMITLPTGLWDLEIDCRIREVGAVSDETATATTLLQIVNSGVSVFSILSRMNGKLLANQRMTRRFRTLVTKETPVIIRTSLTAGLGTSGCFHDLSVIASRIL